MKNENNESFISVKLFISAIVIIAALMLASFIATLLIPCEGIPVWRWLLSPVLVLGTDTVTLAGVILFLLIIGGIFNALDKAGVMLYMLNKIAASFGEKKYTLILVVTFFFMGLGSLVGSFEECVPMVPIVVALAIKLGWDSLVGLGMSLLAVGCGFAAGVFNPFTIGIAQDIAGLPMFSGAWFRALNFVCIYLLLNVFIRLYAKKIDKGVQESDDKAFQKDGKKERAVKLFAIIMLAGIAAVLSSAVITALRDYTFVVISLTFLVAGIVACRVSGMKGSDLGHFFLKGLISMLPAILMILMASSIKYTLQYAGAFDTIINGAVTLASSLPKWSVILFIYLFVLIMNFLIPSGSAKVIMLMPILIPMAQSFGISAQLVIVAYAFGDGFSNTFYPTNPAMLISIGLADTEYPRWAKWSGKFQLLNLLLTSCLLLLGQAIGF